MRYRVPSHVAWVSGADLGTDPGIYVVDVRQAQPLVLRDSAELIWLVAVEGGDLPGDIDVGDPAARGSVHAQVVEFTSRLASMGILEENR